MKLRRYNIKSLFKDPKWRRWFITRGTVVTMAREGIDISLRDAEIFYDRFVAAGRPFISDQQNIKSTTGITREAYECLFLPRCYSSHIPCQLL